MTFAPNESAWRDRRRTSSESVMTGSGNVEVDCLLHRPAAFSRIFDVTLERVEVGVALECDLGELVEPRAHDAAVVPHVSNLVEVELEVLRCVKNLIALGVRLQVSVLDSVVNHLHVMAGTGWTHVGVSLGLCERFENGLA